MKIHRSIFAIAIAVIMLCIAFNPPIASAEVYPQGLPKSWSCAMKAIVRTWNPAMANTTVILLFSS